MGGVSEYAALHSRTRIMYSALLTPQVGASLRDAEDLPALIAVLKNTAYGPYLQDLEGKELNTKQVIARVKARVADVYMGIIHAAPVSTRPLLMQLFRHFEIDNLKAILRGIVTNSSWEQVQGILFPLGSLSVLPAQEMLESGSLESAVALLANTPYHETLTHAMKRYSDEQSLFPLEVALDLAYWQKLWGSTGQDRMQALRVIGPLVDMTNLIWAIRYRIYYHLSEEEIINYTLSFGYHVRDEDIRSIAGGGDYVRILERVYPGLGNVEALLQEPEQGLPKLELQIQQHLAEQVRVVFSGYPFHIGLPLALAVLIELELQDLTVLIEAKAAHMPAEKFLPYLLMGMAENAAAL
jgi:V/A-type H+-transporting ATPase subunit C